MAYEDILTQELRSVPELKPWRLQPVGLPLQPTYQPTAQTQQYAGTAWHQPQQQQQQQQHQQAYAANAQPAAPLQCAPRDPFEEKDNFSWGLKVLTSVLTEAGEDSEPLCLDLALDGLEDSMASPGVDPLLADLDLTRSASRCSSSVHETRLKGLPSLAGLPEHMVALHEQEQEQDTTAATTSPRSAIATAHSQSASDDNDAEKTTVSTDEEKTVSPSSSVGHSVQEGRWGRNSSASGRFAPAGSSVKGWKDSLFEPSPPASRDSERDAQLAHTKTEAFILHDRSGFEDQISALMKKDAEDKAAEAIRPAISGDRTVYIVGIDSATSDEYVLIRLSQFGSIRKYQLCGDPNQPTRYGFFEYNAVLGCIGAQSLDGRRMFTRPIRVSKAKDAIKGGRVVAESHQMELLKSAAVCAAQGIEAPTTRAKDGSSFRRGRRGGAASGGGANATVTTSRGKVAGLDKDKFGSFRRGSPTDTSSPASFRDKEDSMSQPSSPSALSSRFDMKPVWSRRK